MPRVAGVDPGTVSFDLCVLQDGEPVVGSGQPVDRLDNLPKRVMVQLTAVFGQRKLLKWSGPGIAHFFTVWGFIELACLKGDASTNQFGPNPLGKQQTRPRSTGMRLRTTSAWDQESEIELAPHRASPLSSMHVNRGA